MQKFQIKHLENSFKKILEEKEAAKATYAKIHKIKSLKKIYEIPEFVCTSGEYSFPTNQYGLALQEILSLSSDKVKKAFSDDTLKLSKEVYEIECLFKEGLEEAKTLFLGNEVDTYLPFGSNIVTINTLNGSDNQSLIEQTEQYEGISLQNIVIDAIGPLGVKSIPTNNYFDSWFSNSNKSVSNYLRVINFVKNANSKTSSDAPEWKLANELIYSKSEELRFIDKVLYDTNVNLYPELLEAKSYFQQLALLETELGLFKVAESMIVSKEFAHTKEVLSEYITELSEEIEKFKKKNRKYEKIVQEAAIKYSGSQQKLESSVKKEEIIDEKDMDIIESDLDEIMEISIPMRQKYIEYLLNNPENKIRYSKFLELYYPDCIMLIQYIKYLESRLDVIYKEYKEYESSMILASITPLPFNEYAKKKYDIEEADYYIPLDSEEKSAEIKM